MFGTSTVKAKIKAEAEKFVNENTSKVSSLETEIIFDTDSMFDDLQDD